MQAISIQGYVGYVTLCRLIIIHVFLYECLQQTSAACAALRAPQTNPCTIPVFALAVLSSSTKNGKDKQVFFTDI